LKFAIRIDPVWRPLLLVGGATRDNSYVELTDAGARFRCGAFFDRLIPYSDIKAVFPRSWPILYGIGWRSNLRGVIGLVGSYHDVVEVRLKQKSRRAWRIFPLDRLGVSLEEPERFVYELELRAGLVDPPVRRARPPPSGTAPPPANAPGFLKA
jgi:hypothetical protein